MTIKHGDTHAVTVIVTVEWVFVIKLVEVIVIEFVDVLFIMVNISTQNFQNTKRSQSHLYRIGPSSAEQNCDAITTPTAFV